MTVYRLWNESQSASIPIDELLPTVDGAITVVLDSRLFDRDADRETANTALDVVRSVIAHIEADDGSTMRVARMGEMRDGSKRNGSGRQVTIRYTITPEGEP